MMSAPGAFPSTPRSDILTPAQYYGTVGEVVKARKDEYLVQKTIKVKIGTWNTASLHGTEKDLGGWFVQGLGVKGLAQDGAGPHTHDVDSGSDCSDSEIETIEEQEARVRKKSSTLPIHDKPGIAGGQEVDLYVLGLQEVVDIASMTEAIKPYTDPNPAKKWKKVIRRALPNGYKKVVEQQLLGLLLLVFASPQLKDQITSVSSTSVGTGLMGYMGNKGAVSARILVGGATRMTFVNCHLAAGTDQNALARRIWDTNQVLARTRFAPVGDECVTGSRQHESIGDEDYCFWFGDLNYRLDGVPGEDVRRLLLLHTRNEYDVLNPSKRRIDSELGFVQAPSQDSLPPTAPYEESEVERPATASSAEPLLDPMHDPASLLTTLKSLLQHDQLKAQQRGGKVFHEGWREGDINFLPTYKYDVGSVAMFDSGEKKRSPSWCDRILFRSRRDYEKYKLESRAEMDVRERGLYDAVHQEEVLFNYDPTKDGGYDEEQDIYKDGPDGAELAWKHDQAIGNVSVDEYISHQRVLSSDHKPLSALFSITYNSVDPELKMKVQQDVTREFDKAENEARPSITLVLDHASPSQTDADESPESSDIDIVDFGEVQYNVRYERQVTVANTGSIDVVFAMIDRPVEIAQSIAVKTDLEWLLVSVDRTPNSVRTALLESGSVPGYTLQPGESTSINLVVHILDGALVQKLNSDVLCLDDNLVLRVFNGRDFFIPVRGTWLQTCFYRSVSELVCIPSGARRLTSRDDGRVIERQPQPTIHHSAPSELFALTDVLPSLATHGIAEWTMLHEGQDDQMATPPWQTDSRWPFKYATIQDNGENVETFQHHIDAVREALDLASDLQQPLKEIPTAAQRLQCISTVLITFLASLTDGIVPATAWDQITSRLASFEKASSTMPTPLRTDDVRDIVQEALTETATSAHSVSLTFITFMLTRIISELEAEDTEHGETGSQSSMKLSPAETNPHPRSRSASRSRTDSSIATSEISEQSFSTRGSNSIRTDSTVKSKPSWLPSLPLSLSFSPRRPIPPPTSPTATITRPRSSRSNPDPRAKSKQSRISAYTSLFAPIIIAPDPFQSRRITGHRSGKKTKAEMQDLKQKIRVLEALLS